MEVTGQRFGILLTIGREFGVDALLAVCGDRGVKWLWQRLGFSNAGGKMPSPEESRVHLDAYWTSAEFRQEARDYRQKLAPGGTLLCFIGEADDRSGLSYFLSALRSTRDVRAALLVSGAGLEDLERSVEESELSHRVAVMRGGSERDEWRILLASDGLVLPLLERSESGWDVLLKAEALRKPVVATSACTLGQKISFGEIVRPAAVRELADAIRRVEARHGRTAGAHVGKTLKAEMLNG